MTSKLRWLAFGALFACAAPSLAFLSSRPERVYSGLTAHEWGTFTRSMSMEVSRGTPSTWSPVKPRTCPAIGKKIITTPLGRQPRRPFA
jgi:hypothetical protein